MAPLIHPDSPIGSVGRKLRQKAAGLISPDSPAADALRHIIQPGSALSGLRPRSRVPGLPASARVPSQYPSGVPTGITGQLSRSDRIPSQYPAGVPTGGRATPNATSGPPPAPMPTTRALAPTPQNVALSYSSGDRQLRVAAQNAGLSPLEYDPVRTAAASQAARAAAQEARAKQGTGYLLKENLPGTSNPGSQDFWNRADMQVWAKANKGLAQKLVEKTGFRPDNFDELMGNPPSTLAGQARAVGGDLQEKIRGYSEDLQDPLMKEWRDSEVDAPSFMEGLRAGEASTDYKALSGNYGSSPSMDDWLKSDELKKAFQLDDSLKAGDLPLSGVDTSNLFKSTEGGEQGDDPAQRLAESLKNQYLEKARSAFTPGAEEMKVLEGGQGFLDYEGMKLRHGFQGIRGGGLF